MTAKLVLPAVLVGVLALPAVAHADLFSLRAEVHGGGAGGVGVGGAQQDDSFHDGATGATYGALIGAEVAFIDVWVEHHQFTDGDFLATWTQFMTGLDLRLDLGGGEKAPGSDPKAEAPPAKGYVELGLGVGFGLGTGQQVDPPLDNSEVTDKGFVAEVRAGVGLRLNSLMSIGVVVPVSGGYFFKSGPGVVANDENNHYASVQASAMLNLAFKFKL